MNANRLPTPLHRLATKSRGAALLAAAVAVLATTMAWANSDDRASSAADDAPKTPARGADDVLRGPRVAEDAGKDDRAFGKSGQGERARRGGEQANRPPAKVRLWMETMRAMELSPPQREKVDAIGARFQAAREAFEKEHGGTRRALEKQLKESGPDTAEGKQARQQMKALFEKAPRPEAFQTEAFALLTPAQQETFRKTLAEREAKLAERQAGRRGEMDGMRGDEARPPRDGGAVRGKGAAGGPDAEAPEGRGGAEKPKNGEGRRPARGSGGAGKGQGKDAASPPAKGGTNDDAMR